jgi:ABC-2 type transport system permease protein
MSTSRIFALARRIVHQFRHDRPTLALLFVVPIVLLSLLKPLLATETVPPTIGVVAPGGGVGDALFNALEQSDDLVAERVQDEASGVRNLQNKTIDGLLVVPDIQQGVLPTGGEVALELHVRGDDATETGRIAAVLGRALQTAAADASPIPTPRLDLTVVPLYGDGNLDSLDLVAPAVIGFFLFFFVFLLTCISFLRERVNGTMERLLQSPITRIEIVLGYMLGFGFFALVQGVIVLLYSLYGLKVYNAGNLGFVFLIEALLIVGAVNLGIYLSTFARTELQVIQFIPLVLTPQALLSGLLFPVENLPGVLQVLARLFPLTYAIDALRGIMLRGDGFGAIAGDMAALVLFAAAMVALGALTLRREVA